VKNICRLVLFFLASSSFAFNTWEVFSVPTPFNTAVVINSVLALGTDGGVRFIYPSGGSEAYTSEDGLEASEIYGIALSPSNELYAVSSKGLISRYNNNGTFSVLNRSFLEKGTELVPGLVKIAGSTMILGFEDRLAFVDISTGKSIMTLSRILDVSLGSVELSAMLVKGDSLYIALGLHVYVREMDWNNMAKDVLLADPESWSLFRSVKGADSTETQIKTMAFRKDSLVTRFTEGTLLFDSALAATAACSGKCPLVIAGDTLSKKKFPELWNGDSSKITWILSNNEEYYFVGEDSAWYYNAGSLSSVSEWKKFPLEDAYIALPYQNGNGGITAYSIKGSFAWSNGKAWSSVVKSPPSIYYTDEGGYSHFLKNIIALSDGNLLVGVWGLGWRLYSDNGGTYKKELNTTQASCVEQYSPNYIVPAGVTAAPDNSGWFVSYWGKSKYGIAFVDESGEVSCADSVGSSAFAGPIIATWSEDSTEWLLYSSAGKNQNVDGSGGLDVFSIRPISETGGVLTIDTVLSYPTPDNNYLIDLALEPSGRLWGVTYSSFCYFESGMDSVQVPQKISAYQPATLSSIDIDPQGRLWVGTMGSGAYMFQRTGSNVDTLTATHYVSRNGLLNDIVYDLTIDPVLGEIWFVHRNGMTRYFRKDLRDASDYMTSDGPTVKVYPNPFRPDFGQTLTFENISESAVISVYNAGGHLVRSFSGNELSGGRCLWDGKDSHGVLAAPGIYHYLIKKGKTKKQGKLIIIH